ncbi:MAG TPA: aldehyde dehydrogenase family protein [Vicinamibacteria bacterium]|nr:aldehyde dehydrogenase family protein [Vicinamibacteria bacterium]
MALPHLPVLRQGRPYRSLDVAKVPHFRTREPFVEVSQANPGLVRRDLGPAAQEKMRERLARVSVDELIAICGRAAGHFLDGTLPLGDGAQTPEDYVHQTSATTGLPHVMVRRNMRKIHGVLAQMRAVLEGLTRNLDTAVLDRGSGEVGGHVVSFVPRGATVGVVLPSNSPGVHSLWAPAFALKTALVLKPGSAEPWTPFRMVQALLEAGAPPEAFGYYPTDHAGAAEVLRHTGRGILFGDVGSLRAWAGDPRVELHGPGYSKVLLGPDASEHWERYLDVMVASVLENSGRSCVNASGLWVTSHGDAIAEAVAERLAAVVPRAAEDEGAQIAPFANAQVAARISASIDEGLAAGGARDVTAARRPGGRLVTHDGCTYLLPTIVRCDSAEHPLANREFLFPFASVVEVRPEEVPQRLGPTLVLTAITSEAPIVRRLLTSPLVHRLNLGPIPTPQISWDQPHEGNLFDHLYARRAYQQALA